MQATLSGPQGMIQTDDTFAFAIFDEAASKGDVVVYDLDNNRSDAAADIVDAGNVDYSLNHVRKVDAEGGAIIETSAYWAGVALADVAVNARGRIQLRGHVKEVNVATCIAGDCLVLDNASSFQLALADVTSPKNAKVIAIALGADSSNLAPCLFDGINGFGYNA